MSTVLCCDLRKVKLLITFAGLDETCWSSWAPFVNHSQYPRQQVAHDATFRSKQALNVLANTPFHEELGTNSALCRNSWFLGKQKLHGWIGTVGSSSATATVTTMATTIYYTIYTRLDIFLTFVWLLKNKISKPKVYTSQDRPKNVNRVINVI